jgi:CrcB protein
VPTSRVPRKDETARVKIALVAIAGAVGALSRYGIGVAVGVRSFPWATLGINIAGSYLLGLVLVVGARRGWPDTSTVPITIGFLGAFTTFSTFSYETYTMLRTDRAGAAAAYVIGSVVLGVLAAGLGYMSGRAVA